MYKKNRKIKLIIDCNLLIAAFFNPKSASKKILDLIREKKVDFFYSDKIYKEAKLILSNIAKSLKKRKNMQDFSVDAFLNKIFDQKNKVSVQKEPKIIKDDPDDDKFLAVAEAVDADFIISNDHHLLDLKKYKNTRIISPGNFVREGF